MNHLELRMVNELLKACESALYALCNNPSKKHTAQRILSDAIHKYKPKKERRQQSESTIPTKVWTLRVTQRASSISTKDK